MAHPVAPYLAISSMKWHRVLVLPPGWNATTFQVYLSTFTPFYLTQAVRFLWQLDSSHLHSWVQRGTVSVKCLAHGTHCPDKDLNSMWADPPLAFLCCMEDSRNWEEIFPGSGTNHARPLPDPALQAYVVQGLILSSRQKNKEIKGVNI